MHQLQKLGLVCFLLCAAIGGLWFSKGMHMATPEKIQEIQTTTDDFGDKVETIKWIDNPDKLDIGLDLAGPAIALFGLLGLGLFWKGHQSSKEV
jgi:hypothetical protein